MPAILQRAPNTIYIVLGETHPHVKEHHGETYRLMLQSRAEKLGVEVYHGYSARTLIVEDGIVRGVRLAEVGLPRPS